MKVLLDTHAILWALSGDQRLSAKAKKHYEEGKDLFFSVVSLWEIGIKLGLHRQDFQMQEKWWREIPHQLIAQGVKRLDVEPEHCREVSLLPLHHCDPFDRMIIAQALCVRSSILSIDNKFDAYEVKRIW
jgi:PIN domain nuclease of toxin-antitoxin system